MKTNNITTTIKDGLVYMKTQEQEQDINELIEEVNLYGSLSLLFSSPQTDNKGRVINPRSLTLSQLKNLVEQDTQTDTTRDITRDTDTENLLFLLNNKQEKKLIILLLCVVRKLENGLSYLMIRE